MRHDLGVPVESELRTLVVVGSNPPTTSGQRTRARAGLAQEILECDDVVLANIFGSPTYRSGELSTVGAEPDSWLGARPFLEGALDRAAVVVLAYGLVKPAGRAAEQHARQVQWLDEQLRRRNLPVWWVGDGPRHPSRWHRYTFRAYPSTPFRDALVLALRLRPSR